MNLHKNELGHNDRLAPHPTGNIVPPERGGRAAKWRVGGSHPQSITLHPFTKRKKKVDGSPLRPFGAPYKVEEFMSFANSMEILQTPI